MAVLQPQSLSADPNTTHWQYLLGGLLKKRLSEIAAIRLLPDSSVDYAYEEMHLEPGAHITPLQVSSLSKVIEAQYVIVESYELNPGGRRMNVQVVDSLSGEVCTNLTILASDWSDVISQVAQGIVAHFHCPISGDEMERMKRRFTVSDRALELVSRASVEGESSTNSEQFVRAAIELDPEFGLAWEHLAHILTLQNQLDDAAAAARRAVAIYPKSAVAHTTLGTVYWMKQLGEAAREQYLEAARLDPDVAAPLVRLSWILESKGDLSGAIALMTSAQKLEPYSTSVLVGLAMAYAHSGEEERARVLLESAERVNLRTAMGASLNLADGYYVLRDVPKAVQHYEAFLSLANKVGLRSWAVDGARTNLNALKPLLKPALLPATTPRIYTHRALETSLRRQLTKQEYDLITFPFAGSPAIARWAQEVTRTATNDFSKAKALFDALARPIKLKEEAKTRTAVEVCADWRNGKIGVTCQEYTFLYLAMARAVGLNAFYVYVGKDYAGRTVSHACAGTFIDAKVLLIDPKYNWFGIPHRHYEMEDDLRVVGQYLTQSNELTNQDVGLKIVPTEAAPHFWVALSRLKQNRKTEARSVLDAGLKLDPKHWLGLYAQGVLAGQEQEWKVAAARLKECLAINPDYSSARYLLASALQEDGKLREARDQYRAYLEMADASAIEEARAAIAHINQTLLELKW